MLIGCEVGSVVHTKQDSVPPDAALPHSWEQSRCYNAEPKDYEVLMGSLSESLGITRFGANTLSPVERSSPFHSLSIIASPLRGSSYIYTQPAEPTNFTKES